MSSNNLVICDQDINYASRLAAFFKGKKELAFQVKICSNPEQMQEYLRDSDQNILLLNEKFLEENLESGLTCKTIILSEMSQKHISDKRKSIYKYQASDVLLAQILEYCNEEQVENVWQVRKRSHGKAIGIYSPVHRLGQTTFAFEKCKEYAKCSNVLYLNMEAYAGYEEFDLKEENRNMSTLLYYAKQALGNLNLMLTTMIRQREGIDYVPPVTCSEDLQTVTGEEWIQLFREILQGSIYDVLVLDLSECVHGLYDILRFCDEIYLPVADDRIAAAKIHQYEQNLRDRGYSDVAERMIRCDIRRGITGKNTDKVGFVKRN